MTENCFAKNKTPFRENLVFVGGMFLANVHCRLPICKNSTLFVGFYES